MKKTTICIFLLFIAGFGAGCEETSEPTVVTPLVEPTIDEMILENVDVFLEALEVYAAGNNGVYPGNLSSQNILGETIRDLLPEGDLLLNPVAETRTEPIDGSAFYPGAIGYYALSNLSGVENGYYIDAMGEDASFIFEKRKDPVN